MRWKIDWFDRMPLRTSFHVLLADNAMCGLSVTRTVRTATMAAYRRAAGLLRGTYFATEKQHCRNSDGVRSDLRTIQPSIHRPKAETGEIIMNSASTKNGPLQGIKIIDLTAVIMGPYAMQVMADFGAEVIKIESPEGDIMRHVGKNGDHAMGPIHLTLNRGKHLVALDLKKPEARDVLKKIIGNATHSCMHCDQKRLNDSGSTTRA